MSVRTTPMGRTLTQHAQQSLLRHGLREPFDLVDDIIERPTRVTKQADGATVYIQRNTGRLRTYNLVILGEQGIVTGMRNLTPQELKNLEQNYGFNPNP